MSNKNKILCGSAVMTGALAAILITLGTAFAGPKATYDQGIYKLTVKMSGSTGKQISIPEWISLASGTWRYKQDNQTYISGAKNYVVIDGDTGSVYHRTGSPSFMGDLHAAPAELVAFRTYLEGGRRALINRGMHLGMHVAVGLNKAGLTTLYLQNSTGKQTLSITVDKRVTDQDAAAAHLFNTTPTQSQETDTELAVGQAPSSGVKAYWFGPAVGNPAVGNPAVGNHAVGSPAVGNHAVSDPAVGNLYAVSAAEHSRVRTSGEVAMGVGPRGDAQLQVTFYERPGIQTTSATPGVLERPNGELQVSSEPIVSAHAQALVNAFNGVNGNEKYPAWPRSTVTLKNGEQVVVVPSQFDGNGPVRTGFFVITSSSLVSVSGDVAVADIPTMASELTPLA